MTRLARRQECDSIPFERKTSQRALSNGPAPGVSHLTRKRKGPKQLTVPRVVHWTAHADVKSATARTASKAATTSTPFLQFSSCVRPDAFRGFKL
jgi:hypothetical protein